MAKFTKQPQKMPLQKTLVRKQDFDYKYGACNLNFSLKIDSKAELKNFREVLVQAIKDVDSLIENYEKIQIQDN